MPGRLEFDMCFGKQAAPRRSEGPKRLLVMGDFSGASPASRKPLAERPTIRVDVDNLDSVLARLVPAVDLPQGRIEFTELDDFHPDALFTRVPAFHALREARRAPAASGSDLLNSLIGKGGAAPAPSSPATATGLGALMREVVAPHVVPDTRASDAAHRAGVDATIAEQMRAVLHAPAFQALEAAWRGVQWLITNLELDDEDLQLHLFDVTCEELLVDVVKAGGKLANTKVHHVLADRWRNAPDGEPWALLAGLYTFGGGDLDVGLLAALGLIAAQAGGPFIAASDESVVAEPSASWQALRQSEASPWLGLAAPRLLLRLPYGARTDPVTAFAFEEIVGVPEPNQLLWGAPALALALLAGRGGDSLQIDDLPAYTITVNGERELVPCAERFLAEKEWQAMIAAGLMPLASHKHRNAVTVMRMQSLAGAALAGLSEMS